MFAFVDETGNTGENIFDKNQTYFITAALTTRINFDFALTGSVKAISSEHGADQIHANQLDYRSLDLIGPKVHRILKASDDRVLISIVEKKYLLACKMVDTIFDSGENIAVPWHVYNIRQLRLLLVFKLYHIVDEEILRDFWTCLMDRNVERAREQFQSVCDRILLNVDRLPDSRSISIISEALNWARSHPEAI
jgi:hypothetical protein